MMKSTWLRQGAVGVGNWEPLAFRLRTWKDRSGNVRQDYEREHWQETVLELKRAGVDLVITHFYKGYGLEAEADDIDLAVTLARNCRQHGMRIGAYVQWRTFVPETLVREEPNCESWAQIDSEGRKVLPYGSAQSFRLAPCPNNPGFIRYLKKVVSECISKLHPDLVHLDNFNYGRLEQVCHCRYCREQFGEFIRNKYDAQKFKEIFGYDRQINIQLPDLRGPVPGIFGSKIFDPVVRELIEFRTSSMSEAVSEIIEHGKSIDPDLAFDLNGGGLNGVNCYIMAGLDPSGLYDKVDAFWDEERCKPEIRPTGAYASKFRSYKLTRNYDLMQFSYCVDEAGTERDSKKWLAESLAFNRNVSLFLEYRGAQLHRDPARLVEFFRNNRAIFTDRVPVSDIAVVRVKSSLGPSLGIEWAYQMTAEQYLFERGYAFDLIFDAQIDRLDDYKVLVLSGASSLPENFERALTEFVTTGGGLVLIGDVGRFDGHLREYDKPLRERLIDLGAERREENSLALGKGKVAFVDKIDFALDYPQEETYVTSNVFYDSWLIPRNAAEIDAAVEKVTSSPLMFTPRCQKGVVFEYYRKQGQYQVHIFDLSDNTGLKCNVNFRSGSEVLTEAELVTLRGVGTCETIEQGNGLWEVRVNGEGFDTYGILLLKVRPRQ